MNKIKELRRVDVELEAVQFVEPSSRMDKSWIHHPNRLSIEYANGVRTFIEIARNHVDSDGNTHCPCRKCLNAFFKSISVVKKHLFMNEFSRTYENWIFHEDSLFEGSTNLMHSTDIDQPTSNGVDINDDMLNVLSDVCRPATSISFNHDNMNVEADAVDEEIDLNIWSNKSLDMLLTLLNEVLPKGSSLPKNTYGVKRMLHDLGLGCEKIHACKYDCALFWKENEKLENCHVCDESRYKMNNGIGKKIPHKVLRYFPLKLRLQRLFMSRHTSVDMWWHTEKRVNDGMLRHPADGKEWKKVDRLYPSFASDARNVRLGLA
ncbi:uncharacterized protein LOC116129140 [Pistacia vera]|uniref:uncharacterized protein LOC116129140 n=1 Tax=Pistacia vera TaxID=55513 RepID=UPI00126354E9|nr:uncharacterized protein LOC116129140 [Pistacia vera]